MRAVAYLRVSTREQHLGPEAQRAAIEAWAAAQGATVEGWHADLGVSGNRRWDRRPALVAALDQARRAGAVLVVAKLDRLGRGLETMVAIESELRRRRVLLRSCAGEGTDGDAGASDKRFQRGILHAVSGYELDRTSERIRAALAVKKSRGEAYTAVPPFGWRRVQVEGGADRLEHDAGEQATIAFLLERRARGRSLRAVVLDANRAGHRARNGRPLYLSLVVAILRRETPRAGGARGGEESSERQRGGQGEG